MFLLSGCCCRAVVVKLWLSKSSRNSLFAKQCSGTRTGSWAWQDRISVERVVKRATWISLSSFRDTFFDFFSPLNFFFHSVRYQDHSTKTVQKHWNRTKRTRRKHVRLRLDGWECTSGASLDWKSSFSGTTDLYEQVLWGFRLHAAHDQSTQTRPDAL